MRIAFVTPEFVTEPETFDGGLANYILRVSLSLKKLGHEPVVFVAAKKDETLLHDGVEVHRVAVNYNQLFPRMQRWITGHRIDLATNRAHMSRSLNNALTRIDQQSPFDITQYSSYAATGLYRLPHIPAIVRISSYERLFQKAGGVVAHNDADSMKVQEIELAAMKKADAIFGPSHSTALAVEEDIEKHVEVIESPFVLDIKELNSTTYNNILRGKQYLLYWGTISQLKGAKVIEEIVFELLAENPRLHFVFVGKEHPGMVAGLRAAAKGGSDRIIHIPKLPHSQLYPIIQHCIAAVLPSLYDNFPNTCVEGMAFGKPVIGTIGNGFEQLIVDGENGFLCSPGDSQCLLKKINKVLTLSPEELAQIGEKAMARVDRLKPEKVVQQLVDFYQRVIAEFKK